MQALRLSVRAALSTVAAVLLASCSVTSGDTPAWTSPTRAGLTDAAPQGGSAHDLHHDLDMDAPPALSPPTWDDASKAAAVDVATRALAAFARPRIDAATWWAELAPLLSPAARAAYVGTDPANIPAAGVSGEPALLDDVTSPYLATVAVPTDAGTYTVLLSRTGAGAPWLVERLDPPATDPAAAPPSAIDATSTDPAA